MPINGRCPLISIVMPAYNAAKFIGRAIDSVLAQTYLNIELIIADDASIDDTCEIVLSYNDNRVKLIKAKVNSGSAYIPRYRAYMLSSGEYVLNLDSDDYLEPTYVEYMLARLMKSQAEVCCGWLMLVDENQKCLGRCIPETEFNFDCSMTGREAFLHTVPDWKISMAGCLATRKAWEYGFKRTSRPGERNVHDDENVSRYILLYAHKVTFANVKYFYVMNIDSVTHVFRFDTFKFMKSIHDLKKNISDDFGVDSEEYKAVAASDYSAFFMVMNQFIESYNLLRKNDVKKCIYMLKKWHNRIDWEAVCCHYGKKKMIIDYNFILSFCIHVLKNDSIVLKSKLPIMVHVFSIANK